MFNNKKIEKLEDEISDLKRKLFIKNYFGDCPCCGGKEILKCEAVMFRIIHYSSFPLIIWGPEEHYTTHYTTKEGYKNHKTFIDEEEKKVKEWEAKNNKNK